MRVENNPTLIAGEGMILTNGTIYSQLVRLGSKDSVENWREVPQSEYEEWKENRFNRMREQKEKGGQ